MSVAGIWAAATGSGTGTRDATISMWLDSLHSDEDVLHGGIKLVACALESHDAKVLLVAIDTLHAINKLHSAKRMMKIQADSSTAWMYLDDLVTVAEFVAEVFKLMENPRSSDLDLRRALVPFQRFLDSGRVSFSEEGFHAALLCILQEGYLACYQRRSPSLDVFSCMIGGSREAAASEELHRSAPAHAAHLQRVVEVASDELLRLETTIPDVQAHFHRDMQCDDVASALRHVLTMTPIADVIEPLLACALQRTIAARDLASLEFISDIARRHSVLRLPICEAPGPPDIDREPFHFVDGQVVFRDPPGFLEEMMHLGKQHPSVFKGEFEALADTDVWLDFEVNHGDSSNASRRFVPLAWLAETLVHALQDNSYENSITLKNICCQALQLLDSRIKHARVEPETLPGHIHSLCVTLLQLVEKVEASATDHNSDCDQKQCVDEEAEPRVENVTVQVLEFSRHPQMLRQRLLASTSLRPWTQALEQRGLSVELASGTKIFVAADHYDAVLAAVRSAIDFELKPWHVIACAECAELVQDVVQSLPSRQQVRQKRSLLFECPPICDQCESQNPRFSCSRCHRARYCSKECQRTAWQIHSKMCDADDQGALSFMRRTFIEVDVPTSLRSCPSSGPKTVSTSQANPRVKQNPREA